mmetsp:Transcript_12651/g.38719  ORF Transcript_12651/g.38719 Transcript_12651/m.38719 type:complete len:228 (+) Transcript_12651:272-955(+)|eukprot:CAMPEP_0198727794 /NCGR_PEP_ID=MMETSP1475-20131203/5294_1 /TAXON_ID= ORGANISM="Unidentified sp., Strain CCMP1999" /NCGR_SAMPLE_ID=MMETSP1475 /ASSEMBLY_ACC=CAM_ASM_001111 /LENGTH=227 /DNA_ID=CAMNT_0044489937 /DNA_START=211 /DNA_END=894 /DNA_ORIENTATION=-
MPGEMWCDICLEIHSHEAMYHLRCGHGFCAASLLRAYDSYGADPTCPEPTCREMVVETDLVQLLGSEHAHKIMRIRIEKKIRGFTNMRLCPNEPCTQILLAGKEKCDSFCESCQKVVHLEAVPTADPTLASVLSDLGMRICSMCGNGVEKKDGCDKMMCRCGAKFCYKCGADNATCNCTSEAHIFWDNITGTPEGAAFKINALAQSHRIRFRRRNMDKNEAACCTIS